MIKETLPDADIVIDKFHVIQDVEQAISKCKRILVDYRKEIINGIEDLEKRAEQAELLRIITSTPRLFNFSRRGKRMA